VSVGLFVLIALAIVAIIIIVKFVRVVSQAECCGLALKRNYVCEGA
jgi:hypothetical protein